MHERIDPEMQNVMYGCRNIQSIGWSGRWYQSNLLLALLFATL